MNKLVIVGNGFDLAHKYPTSYIDFFKWFWNNLKTNFSKDDFKQIINIDQEVKEIFENKNEINSLNDFLKNSGDYQQDYGHFEKSNDYKKFYKNGKSVISFENHFFYLLNQNNTNKTWGDIENQFYITLIDISKRKDSYYKDNIELLNSEMNELKKLFEKYLKEKIPNEKYSNPHFLGTILKYESVNLREGISNNYLNEFPFECHHLLYEFDENLLKLEIGSQVDWLPQTLILDFNYTHTISNYLESITTSKFPFGIIEHIKIHGELDNIENPINLGFGDEMDINYKELENKNDNKYLKFIKSFMYTNNSNYRKFLNWINANNFQVLILGHSCGLSDRILLNTIFEHENCKSIKVFYYQYESEGKINDDFTERIQNISRHFNDKKLMRSKLVDKQLCKPLII